MLSNYGKENRPQESLKAIIAATSGYEEKTVKKWQELDVSETGYVYIIISGEVDICRATDGLCVTTLKKECVYGITSFFDQESNTYGLVRTETVIRRIKKADFEAIINANGLWPELSKLLAWYLSLLSKRDSILVARSAYSVIREFLLEIHDLIKQHDLEINIYDYIQKYTSLARSTIIKILAELKKGQYISVEKGRLVAIASLPEKY